MKLKELINEEVLDLLFTSKDVGHSHIAKVNIKNGDGNTTSTMHGLKPNSFYRWNDHVHKVKDWKALETEKHTHIVSKTDRPWEKNEVKKTVRK